MLRRTILTVTGAALMAASTAQIAAAAEHHHVRKVDRVQPSEQFRNANNAIAWPVQPRWVSDYSEGHVISAPAGR